MSDNFVKESRIKEKTDEEMQVELIKSIIDAKKRLDVACRNFEYADGDLIDYYAFEIKANRSKLDYLLKKAKSKSITIDMINEMKIRLYEDKVV